MNLGIKFITGVPIFYLCVTSTNFQWWAPTQPLCITEGSLELKTSVVNDNQLFLLFCISLERSRYIICWNVDLEKRFPRSCSFSWWTAQFIPVIEKIKEGLIPKVCHLPAVIWLNSFTPGGKHHKYFKIQLELKGDNVEEKLPKRVNW